MVTFRLPEDLEPLLVNLAGSWFFIPVIGLIAGSVSLLLWKRETLLDRHWSPPPISTTQATVTCLVWFVLDVFLPEGRTVLHTRGMILARNTLALLIGITLIGWFVTSSFDFPEDYLGRFTPASTLISFGIVVGLLVLALMILLSLLYPFQLRLETHSLNTAQSIGVILLMVGLIPLTEEILFRYHLYCFLRAYVGPLAGILAASLLFALAHGLGFLSLIIFCQAILATLLVELTGSILPSLTLHSAFNGIMILGGHFL